MNPSQISLPYLHSHFHIPPFDNLQDSLEFSLKFFTLKINACLNSHLLVSYPHEIMLCLDFLKFTNCVHWASLFLVSNWLNLEGRFNSNSWALLVKLITTKSCPTLCKPMDCQAPLSLGFSGKNTGLGSHSLFQGIFPTQRLNSCFWLLVHWQADSLNTEPHRKPSCQAIVSQTYLLQPIPVKQNPENTFFLKEVESLKN